MTSVRLLILLLFVFHSCAKVEDVPGVASLTLFNATVGMDTLLTNFNGRQKINYAYADRLIFGSYNHLNRKSLRPGLTQLGLYQISDTSEFDHPPFFFELESPLGSIHTLFLTGTKERPDSLLIKENFPVINQVDSVFGLRILNLSPDSPLIYFHIENNEKKFEIHGIGYEQYTGFQMIPAKNGWSDYTVKAFNSATNEQVAELKLLGIGNDGYSKNEWRNHFYSIAFVGELSETGRYAPKLSLIAHTKRY